MSLSPDPQRHGPGLIPALRHLPLHHRHQWWLHGPVLYVLKVHQTEVKSGLVIHAQTPARRWGTREGPSAAFPPKEPLPRHKEDRENTKLSYILSTVLQWHRLATGWQ